MANNIDPDQTPRPVTSDLGLYCLLTAVCPYTQSKYANLIKSNPLRHFKNPLFYQTLYSMNTMSALVAQSDACPTGG